MSSHGPPTPILNYSFSINFFILHFCFSPKQSYFQSQGEDFPLQSIDRYLHAYTKTPSMPQKSPGFARYSHFMIKSYSDMFVDSENLEVVRELNNALISMPLQNLNSLDLQGIEDYS